MQKFNVLITEQLQRNVEIEADSISDAINLIKESYTNEEIVLHSEDYTETFFQCEDVISSIFDKE